MAITNSDVKLFESQRLTDKEDGGGRVTGNEVIDGNVNNLFQDIPRIDRTIGDVALRKAFIGISTDNNDIYLGSHLILTEPPKDKNVSVLLFNTDSQTDERLDARDRIESYVVPGIKASWELVGDQLEGQRAIVGYQREEWAIPEIGEVYKFTTPDGLSSQFIRITAVDHSVVTFTYHNGSEYVDFNRRKVEMEISAPLVTTFIGAQPVPAEPEEETSSIYGTQIADTSRYYGIQPLSANVTAGDLTVKAESVYAPLVPSAKVESPLLDQHGGYTGKTMVATTRSVSCRFVHITGNQSRTYVQRGLLPKTLSLSLDGGTFEDDGAGNLLHKSGTNNYSKLTVDYDLGEVNVWRASSYSEVTANATYKPAVAITGAAISGAIPITNQNRGFRMNCRAESRILSNVVIKLSVTIRRHSRQKLSPKGIRRRSRISPLPCGSVSRFTTSVYGRPTMKKPKPFKSQVSTSAPTSRTTQPAPQKIIRLEYPGGAVNAGIDSTDETKLLEALKNAGMRTV